MRVLRMVIGPAVGGVALTLGIFAHIAAAPQTLSLGEVRLSSRPYLFGTTLRAESRLVQLEVVVRDSHGRAVSGLTKDNFVVFDAGHKRDLAAFSIDAFTPPAGTLPRSPGSAPEVPAQATTPTPKLPTSNPAFGRWIGLLFDDINTAPGDLAHTKIAASRFIKEGVESGDRIAVFTTSSSVTSRFTNDSAAILTAITKLQSHPHISPGGLARCPRMTAYEAYQIIKGDPSAMKAKVLEACTCGGSSGCDALEAIPDNNFVNLTPTNPNAGYSIPTYVLYPILAQAEQTWDQARVASQVTFDAIESSLDQLARMPGKRMLLLASSGFLANTLDQEQDSIINEALRAGVVINSLDAKGTYAEAPGTPINETSDSGQLPVSTMVFEMRTLGDRLEELDSPLARLAESTGGLLFRNNNDLDLGFHQLGLLPAYTYLLGFAPSEDGKYHKIKVELKNVNHDSLQVRPGYFAPSSGASHEPSASEKMEVLMRGSDERTDLPTTVSEKLGPATPGERELTVQVHIDIRKITFEQQKDLRIQKLTFVAALFDSQGSFVTGKEAEMELALKPESFERFAKNGMNGALQLEIPPGTYRLRVVVQEALHGHLSATDQNLRIR
jgi:VWFA-related protein